jgi:hypothetical protein
MASILYTPAPLPVILWAPRQTGSSAQHAPTRSTPTAGSGSRPADRPTLVGTTVPGLGGAAVLAARPHAPQPSSRTQRSPRSPAATRPPRDGAARLPLAAVHAYATSRTTTAAGDTDRAAPPSPPAPARESSAAGSRRDGRLCSTRRRPPCRCTAGCRRRTHGRHRHSALTARAFSPVGS